MEVIGISVWAKLIGCLFSCLVCVWRRCGHHAGTCIERSASARICQSSWRSETWSSNWYTSSTPSRSWRRLQTLRANVPTWKQPPIKVLAPTVTNEDGAVYRICHYPYNAVIKIHICIIKFMSPFLTSYSFLYSVFLSHYSSIKPSTYRIPYISSALKSSTSGTWRISAVVQTSPYFNTGFSSLNLKNVEFTN